tara:strand:- start:812 stop:2530 length:1719 start_codon:yes stop_codon:yes gene_type:complete
MKNTILTLFTTILFLSSYAQEKPADFPFGPINSNARGIFGEDDRVEIKDAEGFQEFARATAVMIPKSSVDGNRIYALSLKHQLEFTFNVSKFDKNVKFLDQPTAGRCSGFLIAPDVFVTAGHCVQTIGDAQDYIYLFDYTSNLSFNIEENYFVFDPKNAYEAVEVLTSVFSDRTVEKNNREDYAVIKLDRQSKRAPYRFRTSGSVKENTNIYTIGAPTGLPLKFSEKAIVVDGEPKKWFKTSIDAFPGNSGGPVFDQNGFIEGILVRGAVQYANGSYTGDYKYDNKCKCVKTVYFETVDFTAGCQTQRISEIPEDILVNSIYSNIKYAIENKLEKRFEQWNDFNWIFLSEHLNERVRLEDIAIASKNYTALSRILEYTIDDLSNDKKREYLDIAFAQNDLELLTLFLNKEVYADVGKANNTLLSKSVKTNNVEFVRTLLSYGANIEVKDTNGNSLLDICAENRYLKIAKLLIANGLKPDDTLLSKSVKSDNLEIVKILLNNDVNIEVKDANENTLLHFCAQKGYSEMAKLLIANGLKPNTKNNRRRYPEKTARKNGFKSLGKYLKRVRKNRL